MQTIRNLGFGNKPKMYYQIVCGFPHPKGSGTTIPEIERIFGINQCIDFTPIGGGYDLLRTPSWKAVGLDLRNGNLYIHHDAGRIDHVSILEEEPVNPPTTPIVVPCKNEPAILTYWATTYLQRTINCSEISHLKSNPQTMFSSPRAKISLDNLLIRHPAMFMFGL